MLLCRDLSWLNHQFLWIVMDLPWCKPQIDDMDTSGNFWVPPSMELTFPHQHGHVHSRWGTNLWADWIVNVWSLGEWLVHKYAWIKNRVPWLKTRNTVMLYSWMFMPSTSVTEMAVLVFWAIPGSLATLNALPHRWFSWLHCQPQCAVSDHNR